MMKLKVVVAVFLSTAIFIISSCNKSTSKASHDHSFYIPTAFSPNGDGKNDYWIPVTNEAITTISIKVFDGNNQVVYASTSLTATGWNGLDTRGNKITAGSYAYEIIVQFANETDKLTYTGSIQAII